MSQKSSGEPGLLKQLFLAGYELKESDSIANTNNFKVSFFDRLQSEIKSYANHNFKHSLGFAKYYLFTVSCLKMKQKKNVRHL